MISSEATLGGSPVPDPGGNGAARPAMMPGFEDVPASRWLEEAERLTVETDDGLDITYDPKLRDAVLAAAEAPAQDLWPLFDALEAMPLALIRGANSDLLSPETATEMRRRRADMVFAEVPGRGHIPFLDEPESLACDPGLAGDDALNIEMIDAAWARIKGHVRHTPLLSSPFLDEIAGRRVLVKPECLQHTGSFKYRGARSALSALSKAQLEAGVIAFSSGNHAQGVALAAREHGASVVIVMPSDAPRLKIENTRALGAEVILYDRATEDRAKIGAAMAESHGLTLIKTVRRTAGDRWSGLRGS